MALYWKDVVAAILLVGLYAAYRVRKGNTKPQAPKSEQAPTQPQPSVGQGHAPVPSDSEDYVRIVILVPTNARVMVPALTKLEEMELESAVPSRYEVLPPLPTAGPNPALKAEVRDPTPTERDQLANAFTQS